MTHLHQLVDLLSETNVPKENIAQLKKNVEEEWRSGRAMSNENDIIQHFSSSQGNNLFLCLLWKMILETDEALRNHEGNEAQVCFFIIQLLLLQLADWVNALGIFFPNLPESYWGSLHAKIEAALSSDMTHDQAPTANNDLLYLAVKSI